MDAGEEPYESVKFSANLQSIALMLYKTSEVLVYICLCLKYMLLIIRRVESYLRLLLASFPDVHLTLLHVTEDFSLVSKC